MLTEQPDSKGEKASAADEHSNDYSGAYHDMVEPGSDSVGNTHRDISLSNLVVRGAPYDGEAKREPRLSAVHTGKEPGQGRT